MKKNKVKLIASLVSITFTAVLAVTASFAWFSDSTAVDQPSSDKGIGGGITSLTAYFDGGTGASDDPFIIDRPIHWANLVELHNTMPGFYKGLDGTNGYYFQVGKLIDGEYKVYTSNTSTETTNDLDCSEYAGEDYIIPIGSPQYPFLGNMVGNNLTVSGFTVKSIDKYNSNHPLEDIGIFGYVGPTASVSNIYFNNYTIDSTGSAIGENDSAATHVAHEEDHQEGETGAKNVFIGTIAGHIHESATFTHVYSNNCTLEGTATATQSTNTNGQRSRNGYFGKVEGTGSGGQGLGNSYKFTLNSKLIVDRLTSAFASCDDNPVAVRDTYFELNKKGEACFDDYGNTINPYTNAVRIDAGVHNLIGDDREYNPGAYTGYNYSLSTTGYWPMSDDKKEYDYYLYYQDNNNAYQSPAAGTQYATISQNTPAYSTLVATPNINGTYIHYDSTLAGTKYQYYKVHTYANITTPSYGTYTITVPTSSPSISTTTSEISAGSFVTTDKASVKSVYAYFYIDGSVVTDSNGNAINYGGYFSCVNTNTMHSGVLSKYYVKYAKYTFSVSSQISITLNNPVIGNHRVGFIVIAKTNSNTIRYAGACDSNSYIKEDSSTAKNFSISQGSFTVSDAQSAQSCTLKFGGTGKCINSYDNSGNGGDDDPVVTCSDGVTSVTPYLYPDSSNSAHLLYGYENLPSGTANPSNPINLVSSKVQFNVLTSTYKGNPNWNGHIESTKSIPEGAQPVYICDGIEGYNRKNIDIIGGGMRFSDTYLTMEAEQSERTLALTLTNSDIGKKFYAAKYCANSIVMFLNNVGNQQDTDQMGYFHINYEWNLDLTNTRQCVFKKGEGNGSTANRYITLADACESHTFTRDIQGLSVRSYSTLTGASMKKASYCALDAQDNIVAVYNSSGGQKYPTNRTVQSNEVSKYVLCLGARATTLFDNLRITKIEFEYSAEGYGGTFGTVDYRSATDQVEETQLNFFYYVPPTDKFRLAVVVSKNGTVFTYTITMKYYCPSNSNAILYFSIQTTVTTNKIVLNGSEVTSNIIGTSMYTIKSASFT